MFRRDKKQKTAPAVLDLFCGAGGMSLGFKNAGCQILGGIDQNKYSRSLPREMQDDFLEVSVHKGFRL